MQLARLDPQLEDNTGRRAHYRGIQSDDPAERTLEIPPGGEASVTLAFRAAMREGTTMSLRFNRRSIANRHPHVLFEDLPIPGRD